MAALSADVSLALPEGISDEDVRASQAKWRLPVAAEGYRMALSWLTKLQETYYAMAFMVPFTIEDADGCIVVTSTAHSSTVYKENCVEYERTNIITDPHWQYFDVWWYPGLAVFNFYELAFGNGMKMQNNLAAFLDEYVGVQWRSRFCNIRGGGMFLESFRRLLREVFGAHNWLEISSGLSYEEYRGLDLYVRCISSGMKDPLHEAWYMLNASVDVFSRDEPVPEKWWWYHELRSWGQRRVMTEWYLEISGAVMTARAARRINRLLEHVHPPGIIHHEPIPLPDVLRLSCEHRPEVQELARMPAAAAKSRC